MLWCVNKSSTKFQEAFGSNLSLMENAIVNSKPYSVFENANNSTSGFIVIVLKVRISSMERELSWKDALIEFLTKQLLPSNAWSKLMQNLQRKRSDCFSSTKSSEDSRSNKVDIEASNPVEHKTKVLVINENCRYKILY